jgi:hypothetical protein
MKRSTRDMTRQELDEFLDLTPHQIYDKASKLQPGQLGNMIVIMLLNLLLISITFRPIVNHIINRESLAWWMWLELVYLALSFGWIHHTFPSPHTARRLCEEQEQLLEQRKRRR